MKNFMKNTTRSSLRLRNCRAFLLAATLLSTGLEAAPTLPTGGTVVVGSGSVATSGSALTVTQNTPKLAINWDSFSIGDGASVRFVQPSATSVALNRVTGADASVIQGALSANGQVFLLNPSGVLFAKTAQVSVGGLVASTLALSNEDFVAGSYTFGNPGSGVVVNEGSLVAAPGGSISLIAARVINDGSISAERGSVNLAAGSRVTLNLGGLVNVSVDQGAVDALVRNGGAIRADGGRVLLTARGAGELVPAAISNEGIVEARTLATGEQGQILLLGGLSNGDAVSVSGRLDVSAPHGGNGGFIETSAANVHITEAASINAVAPGGHFGSWLLDPDVLEIIASGGSTLSAAQGQATGTSQISVLTLSNALNSADVSLQANASIDFKTSFSYAGTRNTTLSLFAPVIYLGGNISASTNSLGLSFGGTFSSSNYAGALCLTAGDVTISTLGGNVVFNGDLGGNAALLVNTSGGSITLNQAVAGTVFVNRLVTGNMFVEYQAGGGSVGTASYVDFSVPEIVIDAYGNPRPPAQFRGSQVFPKGTVTFPSGTLMSLNADGIADFIRPNGTIFSLTANSGGFVTFTSTEQVDYIEFVVKSANWVPMSANSVSWMQAGAAGKLTNLTLNAGSGTVTTNAPVAVSGNVTINAGKFVNGGGTNTLQPGTGKTWQVWSSNPTPFDPVAGDVAGNLPYDFKQYGATYGSTAPLGTGNGMFYTIQPTIVASLVNTASKVYNGNTASINLATANYAITSGAVGGDVLSFTGTLPSTGTYASKDVGTGISITSSVIPVGNLSALSSTGKPVYGYGPSSLTATGNIGIITKLQLTSLTGLTANDRSYNQLTGATLNTGAAVFGGKVSGDTLTIATATGTFSDKNAASGKTVTITGLTLGGTDAGNYELPAGPFTTTAAILKLDISAITGITAQDKVYDGNTTATLNTGAAGFTGLLSGDTLTVSSATGNFVDKNAAPGKTVNITGLTIGGNDAINYNLITSNSTTTAAITKLQLTSLTGLTAQNKTYDGLTGATLNTGAPTFGGLVPGDTLTIDAATGNFVDKNAANGKIVHITGILLGGLDASNYDLPASVTATATILKATLNVSANNHGVNYTGSGYVGGNGVNITGYVLTEGLAELGGSLNYGGSSQGAIKAGTYDITPFGYTAANYDLVYTNGILTIAGAPVVVDPHEFLPKPVVVPVYPIAPMAVQMPAAVGGLNYVAVNPAGVPVPASSGAKPGVAVGESAAESKNGAASDRIDKGASRAIQGPTDILVISGGINLGKAYLGAE
ncbi:MAG: hypothetical protein CAK89_00465 [Opitutia bacterium AMD-G3]|nr:MAG: hypothetical protein CAK89_00465 [Opitutae bacterium AMD-G3]